MWVCVAVKTNFNKENFTAFKKNMQSVSIHEQADRHFDKECILIFGDPCIMSLLEGSKYRGRNF